MSGASDLAVDLRRRAEEAPLGARRQLAEPSAGRGARPGREAEGSGHDGARLPESGRDLTRPGRLASVRWPWRRIMEATATARGAVPPRGP